MSEFIVGRLIDETIKLIKNEILKSEEVSPIEEVELKAEVDERIERCGDFANDAIKYDDKSFAEEWHDQIEELNNFLKEEEISLTRDQENKLRKQMKRMRGAKETFRSE